MTLDIRPVRSKKDMSAFIKIPYKIYRNDPLWVPQLLMQEKAQFDRRKNPAFSYCDAEYFLATGARFSTC